MTQETGSVSALVRCAVDKQWHAIYDDSDIGWHKEHEYDRVIVITSATKSVWEFAEGIANSVGFYETLQLPTTGFTEIECFVKGK